MHARGSGEASRRAKRGRLVLSVTRVAICVSCVLLDRLPGQKRERLLLVYGCPSLRGFRLIESIVTVKWLDNDRGQHQRVVRLKRCLLRASWLYSKFISNPLEKKTIAQSNSWTDTERKKSCQMLIAHFWSVKLKNNNKTNIILLYLF